MQSRVSCLVVGMLSLVFSNLAGAQGYQWTEILVEGAQVVQVFGLNDKGQTATTTSIGSGIYGNGTFTPLPPPPPGYQVTALGINNFGRISGHGQDTVIGRYGFVWQQGTITKGTGELLPFLSRFKIDTSLSASARGINDSGVVTGFASTRAGTNDGFVGNDALGYQRLVAPGGEIAGNSTYCSGINNSNQV